MKLTIVLGVLTAVVLLSIGIYYASLSSKGEELVLSSTWLTILAIIFIPSAFNTLVLASYID